MRGAGLIETLSAADRVVAPAALKAAATKRMDGLLDKKRRRHYDHAARLIACCVELEDDTPGSGRRIQVGRVHPQQDLALPGFPTGTRRRLGAGSRLSSPAPDNRPTAGRGRCERARAHPGRTTHRPPAPKPSATSRAPRAASAFGMVSSEHVRTTSRRSRPAGARDRRATRGANWRHVAAPLVQRSAATPECMQDRRRCPRRSPSRCRRGVLEGGRGTAVTLVRHVTGRIGRGYSC